MRAIWGIVLALAVIFGTTSFASADDTIPVIQDKRGEQLTGFANTNTVFEIVLVFHPCDPDSNLLFSPDDPILQCAEDEELQEYIAEVAERAIGFPLSLDELFIPEVTNIDDLKEQIIQLDTTSELIFEHEANDLTETLQNEQVVEEYEIIKEQWKNELVELQDDAVAIFEEADGIESNILQQEIEKLKMKFDLREEKIKNTAKVQKKIKTAIELKSLKEEFQDSMNEYAVTEKVMKYGDEKDKKLDQLIKQNKNLMKKMLIAEAKHNDRVLEFDDFKKIHEIVTEEIESSVGYSSGQTNDSEIFSASGDANNGNDSENSGNGSDNSGKSSDKGNSGKGSDNKAKGSDKGKSSDNKGKGNNNGKGKGNSKK